jgi:hypothetical protein
MTYDQLQVRWSEKSEVYLGAIDHNFSASTRGEHHGARIGLRRHLVLKRCLIDTKVRLDADKMMFATYLDESALELERTKCEVRPALASTWF